MNILRGDLGVVGPRPEQPHYVDELTEKLPFYTCATSCGPGLTGWAQVKYGYAGNESDALEKLQYEFWYLRHQSLRTDADHRPHDPLRARERGAAVDERPPIPKSDRLHGVDRRPDAERSRQDRRMPRGARSAALSARSTRGSGRGRWFDRRIGRARGLAASRHARGFVSSRTRIGEHLRRSTAGSRPATGDVVVLLSSHGEVGPDFVSLSVAALDETGAAGVGGVLRHQGDDPEGRAIGLAMTSPLGMASPFRFATIAASGGHHRTPRLPTRGARRGRAASTRPSNGTRTTS